MEVSLVMFGRKGRLKRGILIIADARSFSLTHGPTDTERTFMQKWIDTLVALVKDEADYDHGTRTVKELVMATPEAEIEVHLDQRWDELVNLGEIFGRSSDK